MVQKSTEAAIHIKELKREDGISIRRLLARLSDRYVVDRKLGRGGTGVVYLARDSRLGRQVAIKVMHPSVSSRIGPSAFLRETRLTATFQHPFVLPVLDSGCVDGLFYHITPYLAEGSLHDLLKREGRLSVAKVLRIASDILDALDYAHSIGVVHCDLKPENILLSNGHAVLADFGIARCNSVKTIGDIQEISGSPAYMSPEQAAGETALDGRSDLYSFACVLYELLSGQPAFDGPHDLAIVAAHFRGPDSDLSALCSDVSQSISSVITKALSIDPSDRYDTAGEFSSALHSAALDEAPPIKSRNSRWSIGSTLGWIYRATQ